MGEQTEIDEEKINDEVDLDKISTKVVFVPINGKKTKKYELQKTNYFKEYDSGRQKIIEQSKTLKHFNINKNLNKNYGKLDLTKSANYSKSRKKIEDKKVNE